MEIKVTTKDKGYKMKLKRLLRSNAESKKLLSRLGAQAQKELDLNFKSQKDSKGAAWAPLSEVTVSLRKNKNASSIKILQDTGAGSQMNFKVVDNKTVKVGSAKSYMRRHNKGGFSKFYKGFVKIPKRQWLYFTSKAKKKLKQVIIFYLKGM